MASMAQPNAYEGTCHVCGVAVRANEGVVDAVKSRKGYRILCLEHAPAGSLEPPKPREASTLPSIHLQDAHFER
jgi:hypothetical protein